MTDDLFLVDTSVWILALRRSFLPAVKERVYQLLEADIVITTGIVKLELLGGTKTSGEFNRLKDRLQALTCIETNVNLWERAYGLAFELRRKGLTIPATDTLIATCAMGAGAIVVHADRHFDLIGKHTDLKVESFVATAAKFGRTS